MRRLIGLMMFLLAFLVAVIVAVVIVSSTSKTVVHTRNIATNDVHSAIKDLENLIHQYTK
jgi:CHASE3 domain sensor protein